MAVRHEGPGHLHTAGLTRRLGPQPGDMTSFGHRHSLLGHPLPAGELGPPHGRLTEPQVRTPNGITTFRTHELRPGWAPSVPRGQRCSSQTGATSRPAPAAPQRPVPAPRHTSHPRGSRLTRHLPRVHTCSPVRSSPRLWPPGWNGLPLGSRLGLRTPPTKSRTTHAEVGTGHRARTWNYTLNSHPSISNPVVLS
jgi:hypothetical protein